VPANASVRLIANSRPGSAATTIGVFFHGGRRGSWLVARNRAPTAGPSAPSSHTQRRISGLNSGIRVTSDTSR
jgi:hypothetical protein